MSAVTVFQGVGNHYGAKAAGGRHYGRSISTGHARQLPAPNARLKLTRRGQFVLIGLPLVMLAALLLSVAGFLLAPAKASDSAQDLSITPTVSVVVQPGSSLWSIAATVAPDRDPRDVVAEIAQLNNLADGTVVAGQQLFVPAERN